MAEPTSSRPAADDVDATPPSVPPMPPVVAAAEPAAEPRRVAAVPIVVDASDLDAAGETQPLPRRAAGLPEPAPAPVPAAEPRAVAQAAETAPVAPAAPVAEPEPAAAVPVVAAAPVAPAPPAPPVVSAPPAPPVVAVPAPSTAAVDEDDDESADPPAWTSPPPKNRGNRLFGVFMVLAAAGLFQLLFLVVLGVLIAIISGPSNVGATLTTLFPTAIAWAPVAIFFVFYLISVLLFNRAGRMAYVIGSLIVGAIVYGGTVGVLLLVELPALNAQSVPASAVAPQLFGSAIVIPAGFVAREVMLWTGMAVGARGRRVKERNRAARAEYDAAFEPAS